jgi:hypothetical protein
VLAAAVEIMHQRVFVTAICVINGFRWLQWVWSLLWCRPGTVPAWATWTSCWCCLQDVAASVVSELCTCRVPLPGGARPGGTDGVEDAWCMDIVDTRNDGVAAPTFSLPRHYSMKRYVFRVNRSIAFEGGGEAQSPEPKIFLMWEDFLQPAPFDAEAAVAACSEEMLGRIADPPLHVCNVDEGVGGQKFARLPYLTFAAFRSLRVCCVRHYALLTVLDDDEEEGMLPGLGSSDEEAADLLTGLAVDGGLELRRNESYMRKSSYGMG